MNARRLRCGLALAAMLAPLQTASAQIVRYATNFPDAAGWTLDPPQPGAGAPSWLVDATPISFGPSQAYSSAPFSLNFNNGVCYGFGVATCTGITFGNATSPVVDISAPSGAAKLVFDCAYSTEMWTNCEYDARRVQVSNDGFQTLLLDKCFDFPDCGNSNGWHGHTLTLSPSWGAIQIRFQFDTIDDFLNGGAGWFIDDMVVATDCVQPATYCTAKVNSLGCTPSISSAGIPSPTPPFAFPIRALQVLSNKPGLLLYSYTSAATPFQGGFLCLAQPITRVTVAGSGGNPPPPDCSGQYLFDFNVRIRSGIDPGLVPGEDVYAQYWSRDPLSAFGSGLTDALTFVICP